jgi:hypothetical protein
MIGNESGVNKSFERQAGFAVSLIVGLVFFLGLSGPSFAYMTRHGIYVQQLDDGTMFVPYQGLTSDKSFWCAVGDYVKNGLHSPSGTRIFRMSEPPRHAGQGILFSLDGKGAASKTGISVFGSGPAGSLSATTAFALCPPIFPFFFGFGME